MPGGKPLGKRRTTRRLYLMFYFVLIFLKPFNFSSGLKGEGGRPRLCHCAPGAPRALQLLVPAPPNSLTAVVALVVILPLTPPPPPSSSCTFYRQQPLNNSRNESLGGIIPRCFHTYAHNENEMSRGRP